MTTTEEFLPPKMAAKGTYTTAPMNGLSDNPRDWTDSEEIPIPLEEAKAKHEEARKLQDDMTRWMDGEEIPIPLEEAKAKHEEAKKLQDDITRWMDGNNYLFETGIRLKERKLVIYIPRTDEGAQIKEKLLEAFPDIETEAILEELKKGERKTLSMRPGRTAIHLGDGSSATLGTFVRVVGTEKLYALTSHHALTNPHLSSQVLNRDVFVSVKGDPSLFRLGRVVAQASQAAPVIDACLIEPDAGMYNRIDIGTYVNQPQPPIYLRMHEHASKLGENPVQNMNVFKIGYATDCTSGKITEYSRDIVHNGTRLRDNVVTKHKTDGQQFATEGDTGSIVVRSVRYADRDTLGRQINVYEAISLLYMADKTTGESFSIPLPRCLNALGLDPSINGALELATQRFV